jgi:4a-hydroxytetrahydrobiopterin dehydratase
MKCEACRADSPHVTHDAVTEYLKDLPGWQVVRQDDVNRLVKTYFFRDWAQSIAFANRVGEIAEREGHHPALLVEWGRVTVSWWTHVIRGLHRNDFIMAARTEELVSRRPAEAQSG